MLKVEFLYDYEYYGHSIRKGDIVLIPGWIAHKLSAKVVRVISYMHGSTGFVCSFKTIDVLKSERDERIVKINNKIGGYTDKMEELTMRALKLKEQYQSVIDNLYSEHNTI
ncbi:hypothetical protein LCGC14_1544810 [marine sediment metagenome]|uniref:Uncharacterized protein n=1 Tax=marine sediment metagenome TaxID=412755 RepID=A0A0F9IS00_9ZZZZ